MVSLGKKKSIKKILVCPYRRGRGAVAQRLVDQAIVKPFFFLPDHMTQNEATIKGQKRSLEALLPIFSSLY